jgi:hypothetical protein
VVSTLIFQISISLIALLFSIFTNTLFTNTLPGPSLTAVSGFPLRAIASTTVSVDGSINERLLLLPLQEIIT